MLWDASAGKVTSGFTRGAVARELRTTKFNNLWLGLGQKKYRICSAPICPAIFVCKGQGWPHRKQSSARARKLRKLISKRNGARSGRSGHTSRRTFFFDFPAFSLLSQNFPFRRHKACPLHTNIAGQMRAAYSGQIGQADRAILA